MSKKDKKIEQFQTAKRLFELNLKKVDIARFLKVSNATVGRWLRYNTYEEYCEKQWRKPKKEVKPMVVSETNNSIDDTNLLMILNRFDRLEEQINALSYLIK